MDIRLKFATSLILVSVLFAGFTLMAYAADPTMYVRTDGSDTICNGTVDADASAAPNCAFQTIGHALDVNTPDDVIEVAGPGPYPENISIIGLRVTIQGAGVVSPTVDGGGTGRVFTVTNSAVVTITNLTIANGDADYGGGIRNNDSTLILDTVTITNNTTTADGGGIYNHDDGILTMTNSTIISNSAGDDGGGLANQDATAVLNNTTVRDNFAGSGMAGVGGGISNAGQGDTAGVTTLTLQNSFVTSNTLSGVGGGGISNSADDGETVILMLDQTVVSGNIATATTVISTTGYGGGIRNGYFDTTINSGTASVTIDNSTISDNQAINGGGIGNGTMGTVGTTTTVEATNSTVSGNIAVGGNASDIAVGNGGGIANVDGLVTLVNSTVSGNAANGIQWGLQDLSGFGGGIGNNSDGIAATVRLTNTTVASNTATTGGEAVANLDNSGITADISLRNTIIAGSCSNGLEEVGTGTYSSLGYNLANDSSCLVHNVNNKDRVDSNLLVTLGPLDNNGGATQTHALLAGSPAIDAGSCIDAPVTDQRGATRPNAISVFCDVGAVESDQLGVVDLEIVKTVNTTEFLVGDTITYTLVFTNHGPAALRGAVITDIVPVIVTNMILDNTGATITPTNGYTYSWDVADLAWDDGGIITITGQIDPNLTVGGAITNQATITSANSDTNVDNNSDRAMVTVLDIDLSVDKAATASMKNSVTTITYTITISNPSIHNATEVVVSDTLPADVTFVSSNTSNSTSYNAVTGVWNVGTVNAHDQEVLTIVVTGTLSAGETITNTATITDLLQLDSNTNNNTSLAQITGVEEGIKVYLPIIMKASP